MTDKKERIALVPGSFDPFTVGHLNVVLNAAQSFDRVVVAVMVNASKNYMFTAEQRVEIARLSVSAIRNVEVIYDGGMLVDLFEKIGASAIVKGVRNAEDLEYENKMAAYNSGIDPNVVTLYVPADEKLAAVSSSAARKCGNDESAFLEYICEGAKEYVSRFFGKR